MTKPSLMTLLGTRDSFSLLEPLEGELPRGIRFDLFLCWIPGAQTHSWDIVWQGIFAERTGWGKRRGALGLAALFTPSLKVPGPRG